ncbi:50S ribosomal protein L25/general stress protein Ctc [Comamonas sp. Y33R10-2]|uniref:50S ribosomal protein L25/general stress protein Ctc n=1 Tax=Comamonas sp. Y33R10-2 TaxID=2853257 RepID=UPI001C5C91E9|nr:50S ribosomal protein L25/general stress protein Ctc [Comamonas sp. Y33R10-2]QXZ09950.1 50S ribosomal protein L25/general stress protein Ctc [Comamonas sp. Y33R10-2]
MQFVATERAKQGTGASRRLRLSGKTPGIVYGAGETQLIEIDHNNLWHAVHKEAFHSSILDMEINGQVTKVVLRDVQFHPFKKLVQHIDFQRVDANTKLHTSVPLHFEGAEESPAVKADNCTITHILTEVQVICEPALLPAFIKVDLSTLTSKSALGVQGLKLPKGVTAVVRGANKNPAVISIKLPDVAPVEAAAAAPAAPAKKGKK